MAKRKRGDFDDGPFRLLLYFFVAVIILSFFMGLVTAAISDVAFGLSLLGAILLFGWLLKVMNIIRDDHWAVKASGAATDWVLSGLKSIFGK